MAEFVQSRVAPLLPSMDIAETLCLVVGNSFTSLATTNDGELKQVMEEWESCGLLREFIRCSTVPQDGDAFNFPKSVLNIYDSLLSKCPLLVRDKFKEGEPCGDAVRHVINGSDGSRLKRHRVMQKLKDLKSLSDMLQPQEDHLAYDGKGNKSCRNCSKFSETEAFQSSILKCSRCKVTYYCSKVSPL